MKKKVLKYEHKASAKDYLVALAYYSNFTRLLESKGKSYEKLVDWLLEREKFLQDDSSSFPTVKEISKKTGISYEKIPKYFKAIYQDILSLNSEKPALFKKEGQILCNLSMNYLGNHCSFSIGMEVVPRVGDYLVFLFIEPQIGSRAFYVKKIYHDLDQNGQTISVSLSSGSPNSYLNLLKEKAYLNRRISFDEYYGDEKDSDLQTKLLSIYDKL